MANTPEPKPSDTTQELIRLGDAFDNAPQVPDDLASLGQIPVSPQEAFRNTFNQTYPDIKLTPDQAREVKEFVTNLRLGGPAGVILICADNNCQYREACPLFKIGQAPKDKPCPLEATVIMSVREQLSNIISLDSKDPIIRNHINEICQIAALEWRCQMKLAFDFHDVMQQVPAAIDPQGGVHTKPEMSPVVLLINELSQRRSRLLKEITQTPEAKWRRQAALKEKEQDSLSRKQAAQRRILQEAQGILPSVVEPPKHVQDELAEKKSK